MPHYHAVVWMDHAEARVFQFSDSNVEFGRVRAHPETGHLHHKSGVIGAGRPHQDPGYFVAIEQALVGAGEILLVGPGAAKQELLSHLDAQNAALRRKVVGVDVMDHATDAQIVAHARAYFTRTDRMCPQLV